MKLRILASLGTMALLIGCGTDAKVRYQADSLSTSSTLANIGPSRMERENSGDVNSDVHDIVDGSDHHRQEKPSSECQELFDNIDTHWKMFIGSKEVNEAQSSPSARRLFEIEQRMHQLHCQPNDGRQVCIDLLAQNDAALAAATSSDEFKAMANRPELSKIGDLIGQAVTLNCYM